MSRPSDLLAALSRAYNLTETHGLDDPEVRDALLDARDAAAGGEAVEVEVFGNGLGVVGAGPDASRVPGVLGQDLSALGVSRMTIPPDIGPAHLERFLGTLRDAVDGVGITLEFRGAPTGSVASLHGVSDGEPAGVAEPAPEGERDRDVMDLVVSLAADEEAASAGEAAADEGSVDVDAEMVAEEDVGEDESAGGEAAVDDEGAAAEGAGEEIAADEDADEEAPDPVTERIEELVADLRDASPADDEALDAVRDEAARLRSEGSVDALAYLVEELILAAEEGEVTEDAMELAREYAGHGVMARIAIHLGAARQEERRSELTAVACALGRSMASTIADAMSDAPDRSARRTYMEALEEMGDDAVQIAEEMAGDSRWFIARNGVALLGELGDQSAIQHLTTPLAHSDARLRKETVVTLAKLGGDDAGNLCVGMLGDPDADVRGSAAMAVGVLKVDKARRQLLGRLDEEQNTDVQVAILKALGQLGDPASVPAIEKRTGGGLFSRAPTPVRVAAYRALAAIGTPHALSLIEQATEDKDVEIRSVARSLVDRRERAGVAADVAGEEAESDGEDLGLEELDETRDTEERFELE